MSLAASCLPPFLALSFLFSIPSPSSSHSFASLPISAGSLTYFPHPCKGRDDNDVRSGEDDGSGDVRTEGYSIGGGGGVWKYRSEAKLVAKTHRHFALEPALSSSPRPS